MSTATDAMPAVGDRENQSLEFKARVRFETLRERLELAKDVAALANAAGGRIFVGAVEEGGTLSAWLPMQPAEANAVCSAYEVAGRDFCVPSPLFDCVVLDAPLSDGRVVCVDVRVQLGRPLGVRIKLDATDDTAKFFGAEPAFRFPVRVGCHTRFYDPSNLPYTDERRVAGLFATLTEGDQIRLTAPSNHGGTAEADLVFLRVDPVSGEVFTRTQAGRACQPIPLFDIHNVLPARGSGPHLIVYKNGARIRT